MCQKINLTNWTCFSDRRNSKSYVSADKKWMVKFAADLEEFDENNMTREFEMAQKAYKIGVSTPKVKDLVMNDEGRKGIIYEYIENKKSLARYVAEDLDNIDMYMKKFAEVAKEFHEIECDTNEFESVSGRVREQITIRDILLDHQKLKALRFLDTIEEKTKCVHGDFQTGNFILAGDKSYAIDLNFMGYGNPEFDIATFYHFCFFFPKEFTDVVFHCDQKYLPIMWESFIKHYYEINSQKAFDEITEKMRKLATICLFNSVKFMNVDKRAYDRIRGKIDNIL